MELSKAELHVEKGEAPKHQHCEVGYEEGTLKQGIRKAPWDENENEEGTLKDDLACIA